MTEKTTIDLYKIVPEAIGLNELVGGISFLPEFAELLAALALEGHDCVLSFSVKMEDGQYRLLSGYIRAIPVKANLEVTDAAPPRQANEQEPQKEAAQDNDRVTAP